MMWIQCLITVLRQFFKSICTTKQSDGKHICCALITDYYNPMNKHLSCQHLWCELLPHDYDAIWIFHCMHFSCQKSHSHVFYSSNGRKAAHRVSCWPQSLRQTHFSHDNNPSLNSRQWRNSTPTICQRLVELNWYLW